MKRTMLFLLIVSAIILANCSDKSSEPGTVKLGEPFWLEPGQSVVLPGPRFVLKFNKVEFDGRCPVDPEVYCFWEGMAEIEMSLDMSENARAIQLDIMGFVTSQDTASHLPVTASGYRFTLRQLDPMPSIDDSDPSTRHYRALLEVDAAAGAPETEYPPVQIVDSAPSVIHLAPFFLDDASVAGNTLALDLGYSGGCESHYFVAFMSPSTFLESNPVQANLYLRHVDNGDMCEAFITETKHFDLTPIAELYQSMYGSLDPIVLNVHEYLGSDSMRVVSVEYDPVP